MQEQNNQNLKCGSRTLSRICKLLLIVLIATMFFNLVLRFGFNSGSIKLQDLQSYLFGILILLSIAFAFARNAHVRADASHNNKKANGSFSIWLEVVLALFSFTLILYYSLPGVIASWAILEGSTEPDGLDGYFLVRTALPILCILVILILIRKIWTLRQTSP